MSALLILLCGLSACGKKASEQLSNAPSLKNEDELLFGATRDFKKAVKENNVPKARVLLSQNPQIKLNQILEDGETYLIIAIRNNFLEMRNLLMDNGANLERVNVQKDTPLMVAIKNKREASARVLIEKKVNLDTKDNEGNTALHLALKFGSQDVALILIRSNANISISNNQDKNPYALAQENKADKVTEVLRSLLKVQIGAPDIGSFTSTITSGDVKLLNQWMLQFPKIARDYETTNPLMLALRKGNENISNQMIGLLLAYGANPNGPKDAEITPLIQAIKFQFFTVVDQLMDANANPSIPDFEGKSPLIHAVEVNNLNLVKMLVKADSNETYTRRINGKRYTFNACSAARDTRKTLISDDAKDVNRDIQKVLSCRLWWDLRR